MIKVERTGEQVNGNGRRCWRERFWAASGSMLRQTRSGRATYCVGGFRTAVTCEPASAYYMEIHG